MAFVTKELASLEATGARSDEPELYRLKGELLLLQASRSPVPSRALRQEAEARVCRAVDVARDQRAKSLELRASTSLSRLWQAEGRRAEARALLSPMYGWFTEGFDTADLKDAKALLDDLA